MGDGPRKPQIDFPHRWGYKVIGTETEAVAEAARECVALCLGSEQGERDVQLEPSRTSGGGKYVSWSLTLRVDSRAERDELFAALAGHPAVRVVI